MKIKIHNLWVKGSDYILIHSKIIFDKLWSELFLGSMKICETISKNINFLYEHLCYNPRVKINNEMCFVKKKLLNGIVCIIDFC